MTKIVTAVEARKYLADVVNHVAQDKEYVIVTRRGKAMAAIIPIEDAEFLREWEDRIDLADAEIAPAEAREIGTIPWEKMKADLGLS